MTNNKKNIILLEPFYSGSHRQWAEGFRQYSGHSIEILSLPGRHWKWRMHGGAVSLAKQFNELEQKPDLILGTSMLDFSTFLGLSRGHSDGIPTAMYFHENQLTYPWSPQDRDVKNKRNNHYAFINYTSALVADRVFFNSEYHKNSFLDALPAFLKQFPDRREKANIDLIAEKSEVLPLGMDLNRFDAHSISTKNEYPILVWNHRWEYDKNPEEFFDTLFRLQEESVDFRLVVLGEQNDVNPPIFEEAKSKLSDKILHWGYAESFEDYARWLWKADILPVTSKQDFFGGSVVEAMYCGCMPLLPNRLAYPGHLSEEAKKHFIYTEGTYYDELKKMILKFNDQHFPSPHDLVKEYDWSASVSVYDEKMNEVINH